MFIIFHQLIMQRKVFNCASRVSNDLYTWFLHMLAQIVSVVRIATRIFNVIGTILT